LGGPCHLASTHSVILVLVPHVMSVLLICVSSCFGFVLWCCLPPCFYSQCAPALVPHVMSVLLIFVCSCSGFALGCSLPPCLYSQCVPALVPHVLSVLLIFVSSCSGCALWCSFPPLPLLSVCSGLGSSCYECAPNLCILLLLGVHSYWHAAGVILQIHSIWFPCTLYSRIHLADFMFYVCVCEV
jgi:hypothetical protein